jgi:2-polyprenyl-3-methyl-5-hydroxy-6-metoxy-1,4-benzoquinol methylase
VACRVTTKEQLARTRAFFNKSRSGETIPSPAYQHTFQETSKLIPEGGKSMKAVDLGCHWGGYTRFMAGTYGQVIGIDFADRAIEAAEPGSNIAYSVMNLDTQAAGLQAFAPIDFYFANAIFEMLEGPEQLCKQLALAAGAEARVLAVIPNRYSINYVSFRVALWIAAKLFRKDVHIYNNGMTIGVLKQYLEAEGFLTERQGAIAGVPPYLAGLLPQRLQSWVLRFDGILLRWLGGSYNWVLAARRKTPQQ